MKILSAAKSEDWQAVAAITRQVHELHIGWRPDIFRQAEEVYPLEYFLEDVEEKHIWVVRRDDTVIAYVQFHTWQTNSDGSVPSKVLDIDDIAIDENHRHRGIGRQILEDLKELAGAQGCNDIQLSVYPQNETAIRFYEQCGFMVRNIRYQMYI